MCTSPATEALIVKFAKVWEVVRASMAAKPYFSPFKIGNNEYIDGGFVENNPSMTAITELVNEGYNLDDLELLQLTSSGTTINKPVSKMGYIQFLKFFISSSIKGDVAGASVQTQKVLRDRALIITPKITKDINLDDVKKIPDINKIWELKYIETEGDLMTWGEGVSYRMKS